MNQQKKAISCLPGLGLSTFADENDFMAEFTGDQLKNGEEPAVLLV